MTDNKGKQLLHLVFGGELEDLKGVQFRDLKDLDIVGIFPAYATAEQAWSTGICRQRTHALFHCAHAPPPRSGK